MIIYLSGPITNEKDYKEKFEKAAKKLAAGGNIVINPANVDGILCGKVEYEDFMSIDMALVQLAEAVVVLPGWRESPGACREAGFALGQGKRVIEYESITFTGKEKK